jgi:hypothetical protein
MPPNGAARVTQSGKRDSRKGIQEIGEYAKNPRGYHFTHILAIFMRALATLDLDNVAPLVLAIHPLRRGQAGI